VRLQRPVQVQEQVYFHRYYPKIFRHTAAVVHPETSQLPIFTLNIIINFVLLSTKETLTVDTQRLKAACWPIIPYVLNKKIILN
jgi:hypothetical protein